MTSISPPAGPYRIINGAIAREKITRHGPVTVPLCNFDARIVAEEVRGDGAKQCRVLVIEGTTQDGKPLPRIEVSADRFPGLGWVTRCWGAAPIIYAGQETKNHLRAAIQLLSGEWPVVAINIDQHQS